MHIDDSLADAGAMLADRWRSVQELERMLRDGEALEGVQAWLARQEPTVNLGARGRRPEADLLAESSAGWLLRLVKHARTAFPWNP